MRPSLCAYCGDLAEQPAHVSWHIADPEEEIAIRLPLCLACSRSWSLPATAERLGSPVCAARKGESS